MKNEEGDWIGFNNTQTKLHLKDAGYTSKVRKGANISDLEKKIIQIEKGNTIFYSDALEGDSMGILDGIYPICSIKN